MTIVVQSPASSGDGTSSSKILYRSRCTAGPCNSTVHHQQNPVSGLLCFAVGDFISVNIIILYYNRWCEWLWSSRNWTSHCPYCVLQELLGGWPQRNKGHTSNTCTHISKRLGAAQFKCNLVVLTMKQLLQSSWGFSVLFQGIRFLLGEKRRAEAVLITERRTCLLHFL